MKDAEQRAVRVLEQSEAEAQSRRTDADAYALRSLRTLEKELSHPVGLSAQRDRGLGKSGDGRLELQQPLFRRVKLCVTASGHHGTQAVMILAGILKNAPVVN